MGDASQSSPASSQPRAQEEIASSSSSNTNRNPQAINTERWDKQSPAGYPDSYYDAAFSSQFQMSHPQVSGSPYNMGHMAGSLPQPAFRSGGYNPAPQRFSGQPVSNQMPSVPQTGGVAGQPFHMPQPPSMLGFYAPISLSQQQVPRMASQPGYYPGQVMANSPQMATGFFYPSSGSYLNQGQFVPALGGQQHHAQQQYGTPEADSSDSVISPQNLRAKGTSDTRQGIVRGPPRKPKQSGHAIWIGNLPPQTDLMQLVHHVCRESRGLESLFLISKSNCAFANFKDEDACVEAQQKLHDSKFQTVRLVSRLRKSTVEGATGMTAPTGPAAATSTSAGPSPANTPQDKSEAASQDGESNKTKPGSAVPPPPTATTGEDTPQKDKFFILKSLTVKDLELSVRTGIWATQAHNEESLNAAFKKVDNVYLIFSANKSGEYFGYARMTSEINADPAAAIEFAPKAQSSNDVDLPRAIPTEAAEFAPKGRIIDDSARGTIFWEAEKEGEEETAHEADAAFEESSSVKSEGEEQKAWGKPFKMEWLSTTRLPFYRTRGLRNPWNSNREVKIARDGTELEPSVGRRLIGLFNRVQSPGPGSLGMRHVPGMAGYPPPAPLPPPPGGSRPGY